MGYISCTYVIDKKALFSFDLFLPALSAVSLNIYHPSSFLRLLRNKEDFCLIVQSNLEFHCSKFLVCLWDHGTVWVKIEWSEFCGYYLFAMEESFSTGRKSWGVIDNVQTLVSKKLQCSALRNVGDAQQEVPSWHCLQYKQSFRHSIELFFNKVSWVFVKMYLFSH